MDRWRELRRWQFRVPECDLLLDLGDMALGEDPPAPDLDAAWTAMAHIEAGGLANQDEGRAVGHYWLRAPELAPRDEWREQITASWRQVERVVPACRREIRPQHVLHLGIGGSALGPQLLAEALGHDGEGPGVARADYHILDNTDADTLERVPASLPLERTVVVVASKSGGTPETRNALLAVRRHYRLQGVEFAPRALAITGPGSWLHKLAQTEGWRARLPLWDWVGGRTSITGPVGLLPAALLGVDGPAFLAGAAAMDRATRLPWKTNPAAWLATSWWVAQRAHPRAMVVLPYADRLRSLGRYLQQLVMESLGKRLDRAGQEVRVGLTVYGNKGSTDQHAYVQQLRDGPDDFFATFIEVQRGGQQDPLLLGGLSADDPLFASLDPASSAAMADITAGDTLAGFLLGTRDALGQDGKRSLTLCLGALQPRALGGLLALFERAVGYYAEFMNINAYNQPGVEAGKKAAVRALAAQQRLLRVLDPVPRGAVELAQRAELAPELAWRILRRLAYAGGRGVELRAGDDPAADRFCST